MDERFTFIPSQQENLAALRVLNRSIAQQTASDARRVLNFAAIYGLPLSLAAVFFSGAFDQILATLLVLLVAAMTIPRLFSWGRSALVQRYCVETDVWFETAAIRQASPTAQTSWPWASLHRLHVVETLILLEFRDWSWIALPNRIWSDQGHKDRFLNAIRGHAPEVRPGIPGTVPSPFSLMNVAAGFGAIDMFLLLLVLLAIEARVGCGCASWQLGDHRLPFWALYAAAISIASASFFPLRYGLRALERRQHAAALVIANLLIWSGPLVIIILASIG